MEEPITKENAQQPDNNNNNTVAMETNMKTTLTTTTPGVTMETRTVVVEGQILPEDVSVSRGESTTSYRSNSMCYSDPSSATYYYEDHYDMDTQSSEATTSSLRKHSFVERRQYGPNEEPGYRRREFRTENSQNSEPVTFPRRDCSTGSFQSTEPAEYPGRGIFMDSTQTSEPAAYPGTDWYPEEEHQTAPLDFSNALDLSLNHAIDLRAKSQETAIAEAQAESSTLEPCNLLRDTPRDPQDATPRDYARAIDLIPIQAHPQNINNPLPKSAQRTSEAGKVFNNAGENILENSAESGYRMASKIATTPVASGSLEPTMNMKSSQLSTGSAPAVRQLLSKTAVSVSTSQHSTDSAHSQKLRMAPENSVDYFRTPLGSDQNDPPRPLAGGPAPDSDLVAQPDSPGEPPRPPALGTPPIALDCQWCGDTFTTSAALKRHLKNHVQEKGFRCPHPRCGLHFRKLMKLDRHISLEHPTNPTPPPTISQTDAFRCGACGAVFGNRKKFEFHLNEHGDIDAWLFYDGEQVVDELNEMTKSSGKVNKQSDGSLSDMIMGSMNSGSMKLPIKLPGLLGKTSLPPKAMTMPPSPNQTPLQRSHPPIKNPLEPTGQIPNQKGVMITHERPYMPDRQQDQASIECHPTQSSEHTHITHIQQQSVQNQQVQGQSIQGHVAQGQIAQGQVAQGQVAQGQIAQGQVAQGQIAQVPGSRGLANSARYRVPLGHTPEPPTNAYRPPTDDFTPNLPQMPLAERLFAQHRAEYHPSTGHVTIHTRPPTGAPSYSQVRPTEATSGAQQMMPPNHTQISARQQQVAPRQFVHCHHQRAPPTSASVQLISDSRTFGPLSVPGSIPADSERHPPQPQQSVVVRQIPIHVKGGDKNSAHNVPMFGVSEQESSSHENPGQRIPGPVNPGQRIPGHVNPGHRVPAHTDQSRTVPTQVIPTQTGLPKQTPAQGQPRQQRPLVSSAAPNLPPAFQYAKQPRQIILPNGQVATEIVPAQRANIEQQHQRAVQQQQWVVLGQGHPVRPSASVLSAAGVRNQVIVRQNSAPEPMGVPSGQAVSVVSTTQQGDRTALTNKPPTANREPLVIGEPSELVNREKLERKPSVTIHYGPSSAVGSDSRITTTIAHGDRKKTLLQRSKSLAESGSIAEKDQILVDSSKQNVSMATSGPPVSTTPSKFTTAIEKSSPVIRAGTEIVIVEVNKQTVKNTASKEEEVEVDGEETDEDDVIIVDTLVPKTENELEPTQSQENTQSADHDQKDVSSYNTSVNQSKETEAIKRKVSALKQVKSTTPEIPGRVTRSAAKRPNSAGGGFWDSDSSTEGKTTPGKRKKASSFDATSTRVKEEKGVKSESGSSASGNISVGPKTRSKVKTESVQIKRSERQEKVGQASRVDSANTPEDNPNKKFSCNFPGCSDKFKLKGELISHLGDHQRQELMKMKLLMEAATNLCEEEGEREPTAQ